MYNNYMCILDDKNPTKILLKKYNSFRDTSFFCKHGFTEDKWVYRGEEENSEDQKRFNPFITYLPQSKSPTFDATNLNELCNIKNEEISIPLSSHEIVQHENLMEHSGSNTRKRSMHECNEISITEFIPKIRKISSSCRRKRHNDECKEIDLLKTIRKSSRLMVNYHLRYFL